MKKFISVLLLSIMAVVLIACSNSNQQSLDGEYYWVSSERNELAFTIKGDKGSIGHGEADNFKIDKQKKTIELIGQDIAKRTEGYSFKDGVYMCEQRYLRYTSFSILLKILSESR